MVSATGVVRGESLDDYFHMISPLGGMSALCSKYPKIEECISATGEWSPDKLELVKTRAPVCIDVCPLDQYGFVQSSFGGREYPTVRTKDFDASSASRGAEVSMYPVALEIFDYDGCTGCSHVKTFPSALEARLQDGSWLRLPRIGRGVYYLPRWFRVLAMTSAQSGHGIEVRLFFNNNSRIRRISSKAVAEYALMLEELGYASIVR